MDTSEIKVLIVDDMKTSRLVASKILQEAGYLTCEAEDGNSALKAVDREKPDVVLMDVNMPDMDGITCCKHITEAHKDERIKLIMVTSEREYTIVKEAFRAGCSDYITKPFHRDELLTKVGDLAKFVSMERVLQNTKSLS